MKYLFFTLLFTLTGCQISQMEASAVYIGAEAATAALLQKHPTDLVALQQLTSDWNKFQGGTLTSADEASLLKTIVATTKQSISPTEAAVLDGATQQFLANTNTSAPTPMSGAAAAIITTVMNGISRGIVVYQTPPSS